MSRSLIIKGQLAYVYASYRTRERAMDALVSMYADGEVSPCEVADIVHIGKRYHIALWG